MLSYYNHCQVLINSLSLSLNVSCCDGWEKAENEVVEMKEKLEAADDKNRVLEDRVVHGTSPSIDIDLMGDFLVL
ncbi:unnamed protein product [Brassica rapa]|uniref:Uncharacterized protein n=1 Tax=Brassica campestris TaxID=3711 RepID=A0A8D9HR87_BRACM|nr:unnamed protein product [Brassica rapa]